MRAVFRARPQQCKALPSGSEAIWPLGGCHQHSSFGLISGALGLDRVLGKVWQIHSHVCSDLGQRRKQKPVENMRTCMCVSTPCPWEWKDPKEDVDGHTAQPSSKSTPQRADRWACKGQTSRCAKIENKRLGMVRQTAREGEDDADQAPGLEPGAPTSLALC